MPQDAPWRRRTRDDHPVAVDRGSLSEPALSTFRFVQFEFPWLLGPADGRYLIRDAPGEEPREIVVLSALGAPQRHLLARRGPRRVGSGPGPAAVPTTRATVINTIAFDSPEDAESWLRRLNLLVAAERALVTVNRVVHAQRIAAADPHVHERSLDDAIVVRAGWGEGERVADGRWNAALELPTAARGEESRRRGRPRLSSDERVAALLAGRESALATEELALRARLDLDAGRTVAAALGTRIALEAAIAELTPIENLAERTRELATLREDVDGAAAAALAGDSSEETAAAVSHALRRVEAALRARAVARS